MRQQIHANVAFLAFSQIVEMGKGNKVYFHCINAVPTFM